MTKFRKVIIFVLILLTIALAGGAIYVGYRLKQQRTEPKPSEAAGCPGNDNFNTVDECVGSCQYGCYQQTEYQQECLDGCYNACVNICQGGTPNSCGNGTCDAPGETEENCPSDCGGGGGTGGDTGGGGTGGTGGECKVVGSLCNSSSECCSGICEEVGNDGIEGKVCLYERPGGSFCHTGTGGVDGCPNVRDWGGHDPYSDVLAAAKQNPGTTFMAGCVGGTANQSGLSTYIITSSPNPACGCPDLNPSAGQCITDVCINCGNPVAECAPDYGNPPTGTGDNPPPPDNNGPYCGDGNLDAGEECDPPGSSCGTNGVCSASCTCEENPPQAQCGDGTCDSGERCEPNGNLECPSGNPLSSGLTCRQNCTYCGDGVLDAGEECEVGIACSNTNSACNESTCSCMQISCDSLTRVGSDNVGPGEIELFNVELTAGTNIPYPISQVVLRVSSVSNDDPVGRDPEHQSNSIVVARGAGSSSTADPNIYNWSYVFAWEATNTDGSSLVNGDYNVEVSFDNGNTWQTSPCTLTFTYDSGEEVEPAFLIIKTSSVVCSTTEGADISYTIRVTNLGPGAGVIDYVEDQLDSGIQTSWVANIGSSRGIVGNISGRLIRWVGTLSQRSYDEGQSATFSYTVSIPASSLNSFIQTGVENMATVVYSPDQNRFTLVTELECSAYSGTLPSTGISDKMPFLLSLMAILTGLIAYKLKVGETQLFVLFDGGSKRIEELMADIGFGPIVGNLRKRKLEENVEEKFVKKTKKEKD